ncbi:MAG TPA: AAA family ATPase [Acidimicrobiales bacterium]|nr:AAA family ATPase [Acidimicrobiales bacterium]
MTARAPVLVLMSGLPGVGKSAIADVLGERLPAAVIAVDEIEAAILRSRIERSFETGLAAYNIGAALAGHQLDLDMSVIADAANYLEVGRQIWRAACPGADVRVIEVVCSDEKVHEARLAQRERGLEPFPEPSWRDVMRMRQETEPWLCDRLTLDSVRDLDENVRLALDYVARAAR